MGAMEEVEPSSSEVEVMVGPRRRRFTAEYKLRILRQADGCSRPGEVGTLLRREGLYSSNLTAWRKQREKGELGGVVSKARAIAEAEKPFGGQGYGFGAGEGSA